MTMALCLQHTVEWWKEKYNWASHQCGVQYQSLPAYEAGDFYVSIDDQGVATGPQSTNSLKEVLTISVGIWKRKDHFQKGHIGDLKLPEDKYLNNNFTLYKLERMVVVQKPNFYGLHQNWQYLEALNYRYSLPHADRGADFRYPFYYRGRGGMINQTLSTRGQGGQTQYIEYYGYILRFEGLAREQYIQNEAYSLG